MPRQPRIQFEGAIYYCSSTTLPGLQITGDEIDRDAFEAMLAELILRTQWKLFSWALLDSSCHFVFQTPQANLVRGMAWLLNSWVKHFNARHRRTGSLFAGRYRHWLVEQETFLPAIIDQVHLMPLRQGLVSLNTGMARYSSSSLRDYLLPSHQRRSWISAAEGLAYLGYDEDSTESRGRYLDHLEAIAAGSPQMTGGLPDLSAIPRRGWHLGTRAFRRRMLAHSETDSSSASPTASGAATALQILNAGLAIEGLTHESLEALSKSDWRKRAIGRAIRKRTVVPTEWITANLNMGVTSRAARLVGDDPHPAWGRGWQRALSLVLTLDRVARQDTPESVLSAEGDEEELI